MAVHAHDEALMCRIFPSSLEPMVMRWFDGLRINSISSFKKLIESFCSQFVTCSRVPQPLDSLLSMSMREGESVKAYSERNWEMFNEIDGDFDEVAIKTFKVGLPFEYGLRKFLTGKPRGGNSCSRVGFVSCQVMSIRLHRSTLTRHVY